MELNAVINSRRAYRSLKPISITDEMLNYISTAAGLAPSCFNNQPYRYVFVTDESKLEEMRDALSKGNHWADKASMIIAVFSEKELDCLVAEREYYLFDCGLSAGFLILAATDLGLVAHPIAGYSETKAKEILKIPPGMRLITLIIIGKHDIEGIPELPENKQLTEHTRPERKPLSEFIFMNEYKKVETE